MFSNVEKIIVFKSMIMSTYLIKKMVFDNPRGYFDTLKSTCLFEVNIIFKNPKFRTLCSALLRRWTTHVRAPLAEKNRTWWWWWQWLLMVKQFGPSWVLCVRLNSTKKNTFSSSQKKNSKYILQWQSRVSKADFLKQRTSIDLVSRC